MKQPVMVVPNTQDIDLMMFWPESHESTHVIAWAIELFSRPSDDGTVAAWPNPITCESGQIDGVWCFRERFKDGTLNYVFPSEITFDDWEDALAYGTEQAVKEANRLDEQNQSHKNRAESEHGKAV